MIKIYKDDGSIRKKLLRGKLNGIYAAETNEKRPLFVVARDNEYAIIGNGIAVRMDEETVKVLSEVYTTQRWRRREGLAL